MSAGVWATVFGIAVVIVGPSAVAAVPNTPSLQDALKAAETHGLLVKPVAAAAPPSPREDNTDA